MTEFACGAPLPFAKLLKGLRQLVVLLQKVIGYPFDPFASGNRELHATQCVCVNGFQGSLSEAFYIPT